MNTYGPQHRSAKNRHAIEWVLFDHRWHYGCTRCGLVGNYVLILAGHGFPKGGCVALPAPAVPPPPDTRNLPVTVEKPPRQEADHHTKRVT